MNIIFLDMEVFITDDDMCTTQKLNLARVQKWIESNGSKVTDNLEKADKILCMTCNGWALLEENSYKRIIDLKPYHDKTVVVGCINDAHPQKVSELFNGPTVKTKTDKPYSFGEIEKIFPDFKIKLEDIPAQYRFRRKEDYRDYNPKRSFINIAEGCSFNCSFCTHKPGLGNLRSRTEKDILAQVEKALEDNCNIINIMGMETGFYGKDTQTSLAKLLKKILTIFDEKFEIQIGQYNPMGLKVDTEELIEIISNKRVKDMQIPIQSTSTRILNMMRRPNNSDLVRDFVTEVKSNNPRICFRTDLIVGWPSETEDERIQSLDFAGKLFDEVATYTIELHPDLPAWQYKDISYSPDELKRILNFSKEYLKRFKVMSHSGQQDDATMSEVEERRKALRESLNI